MQFLSVSFIIFWALSFALYYLFPPKMQWYVLLVSSLLFYVAGSKGIPVALLVTAFTTYGCGLYLLKALNGRKRRLKHAPIESRKSA